MKDAPSATATQPAKPSANHASSSTSESGASGEVIVVEVAYAKPDKQMILTLEVPLGTAMFEAAERSNIVSHFPEIDLEAVNMGIFGKLEKHPKKRVLKPKERVEIYRPLLVDPKEVRKRRAEQARQSGA